MTDTHALIIDDNPLNVDVLVQLLRPLNVDSTVVLNPLEIENIVQQLAGVDVVFLDLEMPDRDGYEVFRTLKGQHGITAPIVAYTVHTSEANNAAQMGFDGFLAKPLDADRFPEVLRRILDGERVWNVRW